MNTREELAAAELAKLEVRLAEAKQALANLRGDDLFVIYTGDVSCPVFVRFNPAFTGVMPNIGLRTATRLSLMVAAELAPNIRNGKNEVAHFCSERRAMEMEIAMLESVRETMSRVATGLFV